MTGSERPSTAKGREILIRDEAPPDFEAIRVLVAEAFGGRPYSNRREHLLVDALRDAGAMTLALVAEDRGGVVGHVAFSPVRIDGRLQGWYGLGPLAVLPDRQGEGIGQALVRAGLARLAPLGARGCVLLGDPAFYGRFGFAVQPQLRLDGVPPEYFMALALDGLVPAGTVAYHAAFSEGT
ncbi:MULTISPECIES: GNAT family N-acetyltransferase [unclassified Inquilinus]|uniref:GNAT family N-acetyltransferase n=1 Tax=unclassified Inquilinus TaxID=2645927 RepID=UPI003F8EE996